MPEEVVRFNTGETSRLLDSGEIKIASTISSEKAEEIFGNNFLGPVHVEKAFGIKIPVDDIPLIKFTEEELKLASKRQDQLILRVNKTSDGKSLTMDWMNVFYRKRSSWLSKVQQYYSNESLIFEAENESFNPYFTTDTPRLGWALVSKSPLPGTRKLNYLDQTILIADHLTNHIFTDIPMPQHYVDAIDEFNSQHRDIDDLIDQMVAYDLDLYQDTTQKLARLQLNVLCRQTPVEVLYDFLINLYNKNRRLYQEELIWTGLPNKFGNGMHSIGEFGKRGAYIDSFAVDTHHKDLNVLVSRLA